MDPTITRRILGTSLALLLLAGGRLLVHVATTTPGSYPVTIVLGTAGAGLGPGSDVKLRGVRVGSVTSLDLDEGGRAVATAELLPEHDVPSDVRPVVTAKTLLGEKQVELRHDGPLTGPSLRAGAVLTVAEGDEPTELETVVASIEQLMDRVDPGHLAALVDGLGGFDRDDARTLRQAIDVGRELSGFGARTATEQVDRLAALADVASSLATAAPAITRTNTALPDVAGIVTEHRHELVRSADALSSFARGLAELLETEEATIRRLFELSDAIGASLDPRMHEVGRMLFGLSRYALVFGQHGGGLADGSEHAWFRSFLGEAGMFGRICDELPPPLEALAPGCTARRDRPSGVGVRP